MEGPQTPPPTTAQAGRLYRVLDTITTSSGLVLSAVLIAIAIPVISTIRDPDFWWHLRTGQMLRGSGSLLGTDPFTYTVASHHWTMHEWATEVAFAWLRDAGGIGLIAVILAFITWLGLIAIFLRARLDGPHPIVAAAGMLAATLCGYPIWGPRAQMLTFALACLVLLAGDHHLRHGGKRIWLLVPLFIVWSNFHSGFIIGTGFLVVMAVADLIGGRLRWTGSAMPRRAWTVLAVAVVATLAAMINPNGPEIVLYPFATQGSPVQQEIIQEWHAPNFHLFEIMFLYAPMLFSLVAMIIINRSIRARDLALLLVGVVLSLQSIRHIALFVAAATPVWITQAGQIHARLVAHFKLRPSASPPLKMRLPLFCLVMLFVVAVVGLRIGTTVAVAEDSISYARDMPVCAVQWIEKAPGKYNIFNQYGEGGYLSYKLSPRGDHVFIFGDAALMGDDLLIQYSKIEGVEWDWEQIITSYNTDMILFDRDTPITNVLEHSPRWKLVYADPHSEIFVPQAKAATMNLPTDPLVHSPVCDYLRTHPTADPASEL